MKCKCGCEKEIPYNKAHRYYTPQFISGHNTRTHNKETCICISCKAYRGEHIPWNKGLTKEDLRVKLNTEMMLKTRVYPLGKDHQNFGKEGLKGNKNGNYKHGLTKNNKCIDCGIHISWGCKRCNICSGIQKYKDNPELRIKVSLFQGGTGVPYENSLYPQEFNKSLRDKIRKRDNYTCQNCRITEEEHLKIIGTILNCHHIDYNKKNNNEENLITLCKSCNIKANINRDYWKEYYKERMLLNVL